MVYGRCNIGNLNDEGVNKIMGRGKVLSSFAGALMLTSMLSFSNAMADTNTPTIPQDGPYDAPGQAYLDPAKAPYAVGNLTSTLNVQGFYQSSPYTDSNAIRQEVRWYHPNSSWVNDPTAVDGKSIVSFGLATVSLEDGSGRTGNFYLYNIDTLSSNNGYGLISVDDVPAWVQMLGGDLNKIQQDMANGTLDASSYMDDGLSQWHVVHLGQLAKLCGWTLAFDNGTDANNIGDPMNGMYVAADQTKATPTFKLFPNQNTQNQNPNGTGTNGNNGNNGNNGGTNGTGGSSNNNNGGNGSNSGSSGSSGTQAGNGGSISQNPATSDGDIAVKFDNYLWNHWPKNGETGHVDMVLTNTNDYDGAGIEYDLKAWSDDNSLFQPVDIEKAVVNVPAGQSVTIPLTYKVQREFKNYKWQGYHIHYTVTIRPHVIPGSPDDPPPPPLNDSDPTNDTAKLDQYIIGPPRLVK
jgi:uncharacterized membrane protein YgcG